MALPASLRGRVRGDGVAGSWIGVLLREVLFGIESSVYHLAFYRAARVWLAFKSCVLNVGLSLSRAVLRCRELQLRSNFDALTAPERCSAA